MNGFRFITVLVVISVFAYVSCSINDAKKSNTHPSQTRQKGSLRHLSTHGKSKLTYRDHSHGTKNCEGHDPSKANLTVTYNEPLGLNTVVNETSKTAYIIDYKNDVGLLLNGQNGVGILIDYNTNTTYKLDGVWIASKEPIGKFIQNVTSLEPLLETAKQKGGGTPLAKPPKDIEEEIARDITNLAGSYHPKDIENYLGRTITVHFRGYLKVFYKGVGSFQVNKDLRTLMRLNLALADWLAVADDIDAIGTLDAGYTFSSRTGLAIFLNFWEQINDRANLAKVFRTLLTSQQPKFFRLITEIERAVSHEGIDGFDILLTDLILLLSGNGTFKETFNDLLRYTPNDDLNPTVLSCYIDRIEVLLRRSLDTYKNDDVLGWLYDFVVTKTTGQLVIFNVNISDLVHLLTARNLGQIIQRGVKVLGELLSPQNIPSIVQWFLSSDVVQDSLKLIFPSAGRFRNVEEVLAAALDAPAVRMILPQILEFQYNITKTINETIQNDLGIVLNDISNGSFGAATSSLMERILKDIKHFANAIFDRLGFSGGSFRSMIGNFFEIGLTLDRTASTAAPLSSKERKSHLSGLPRGRG